MIHLNVDYISDLHLDFHSRHDSNYGKWKRKTEDFLEQLLPHEIGQVLVIAGDISHYNIQSFWCLNYFSVFYNHVFFTTGNHDYYLISNGQNSKYKGKSLNREIELEEMVSDIPNVSFLKDFTVHDYNGFTFAGSTFWYPLTTFQEKTFFKNTSNDSRLIKGMDIGNLNYVQTEQYNQLSDVDVIVTHVPPIYIHSHHKYGSSDCYLNQINELKSKYYVFGHCHEQNVYAKGEGKFHINALGYPNECYNHMDMLSYSKEARSDFYKEWYKIKSFNV